MFAEETPYLPDKFDVRAFCRQKKKNDCEQCQLTSEEELIHFLSSQEVNAFVIVGDNISNISKLCARVGFPTYHYDGEGKFLFLDRGKNHSSLGLFIKRFFDIFFALLLLLFATIVGVIIYPIVQSQSKGPMLFIQERVGKNGKRFKMYKFRSMYLDAEKRKKELMAKNELNSNHMFKMDNDPRIFPFGHKMRSWSIDELPQAVNILKGDMSLIGTRPPTVDEYLKYDLHHFKRLAVKPGVTGMWQVSGRSNITDFEEVVKLDTAYIDNWSIWLDIKIIFKTIKVVLMREGSK